MLEVKKNRLTQLKKDLKELFEKHDMLNEVERGPYKVKIREKEKDILDAENEIIKLEKSKPPKEIRIYFYIIVSLKDEIKKNMAEELYKHFDEDRYHETEHEKWKPFSKDNSIDILVSAICKQYPVNPIYLDGEIDPLHWVNLDNEVNNSVAIIDLFSLDNKNNLIALKFDTEKAGVLMPLCRSLDSKLYCFAQEKQSQFKAIKSKNLMSIPCDFFLSELSGTEIFYQQLLRVFKNKFPISNQSSDESDVRGIKI